MKYIKIKNNGLIEPNALHLVGASSKRNDSTKIGQFGSGNKYALAYFLRNGHDVKVFSGKEEIEIKTIEQEFRGEKFEVITINGKESSITTQMGKDWKFWQALREFYSNAIDEGGVRMDFVHEIEPVENETHFYIESKGMVTEFVSKFDNYFATNKKVLFECSIGRILEKSGDTCNIFRKGIRCFDTKKNSCFDYDFNEIDIDENRLVRYFWEVEEKIWSLIYSCTNSDIINTILFNCHSSEFIEGSISDISSTNASTVSEEFKNCIRALKLAPRGLAGMLNPDEIHSHTILPTKIFQSIRGLISDENVGIKFRVAQNGVMFREFEPSELHLATIRKCLDFFKECNFEINYPVKFANFDNPEIMGMANKGEIIISQLAIEKGVNYLVNVFIEEFIHIKYSVHDCTREFQNAIIDEFITYLKTKNAYLL